MSDRLHECKEAEIKDEAHHPEWTLSPTHHRVLMDMRAAGEKRQQLEKSSVIYDVAKHENILDQYQVGRGIHAPTNK